MYGLLSDDHLSHHGVQGQKWGVRNGPPYPLSRSKTEYGYEIKKYTSPGGFYAKSFIKSLPLTLAQAFIPGLYHVRMVNYVMDINKQYFDGKDYVKKEGEYEKISDLKKKNENTSVEDDVKKVNPRIGHQRGKINNCFNCTVAMEMRSRGYDVQARSSGHGVAESIYEQYFKGCKLERSNTLREKGESRKKYANRAYDQLCVKLEKFGEGSSGCCNLSYEKLTGGGHTLYWKVTNGTVNFYDGQSKKINPSDVFSLADPKSYSYARLDNLKLTDEVIKSVISVKKKR